MEVVRVTLALVAKTVLTPATLRRRLSPIYGPVSLGLLAPEFR